jgi:ArsR family transcriptional regulator
MSTAAPATMPTAQFERIAKALADPRRFALLERIAANEEYPCSQLCQEFPVSKATISHHVKELIRAGLVRGVREGQHITYFVQRDVLAAYSAALQSRLSPGRSARHRS